MKTFHQHVFPVLNIYSLRTRTFLDHSVQVLKRFGCNYWFCFEHSNYGLRHFLSARAIREAFGSDTSISTNNANLVANKYLLLEDKRTDINNFLWKITHRLLWGKTSQCCSNFNCEFLRRSLASIIDRSGGHMEDECIRCSSNFFLNDC